MHWDWSENSKIESFENKKSMSVPPLEQELTQQWWVKQLTIWVSFT
jgi:hypothetical protein